MHTFNMQSFHVGEVLSIVPDGENRVRSSLLEESRKKGTHTLPATITKTTKEDIHLTGLVGRWRLEKGSRGRT